MFRQRQKVCHARRLAKGCLLRASGLEQRTNVSAQVWRRRKVLTVCSMRHYGHATEQALLVQHMVCVVAHAWQTRQLKRCLVDCLATGARRQQTDLQ